MSIYVVDIETTLCVVADTHTEAVKIARKNLRYEIAVNEGFARAHEAKQIEMVPPDWRDCVPWGGDYRTVRERLSGDSR